ncbi:MAG: hypothetical protein AB8I08_27065 [Sandaracinaceae bacterium]
MIALTMLSLSTLACGSAATPPPPEEEVSAEWTSGDDAPLEAEDE